MIDQETMADIRRRINPQYQDTIGTESYERKLLVDEIDRLKKKLAQAPLIEAEKHLEQMKGWAEMLQNETAHKCAEIAAGHKRLSVVDDRFPGGTRPSERVAYDFACGDIADAIRKEFSLA